MQSLLIISLIIINYYYTVNACAASSLYASCSIIYYRAITISRATEMTVPPAGRNENHRVALFSKDAVNINLLRVDSKAVVTVDLRFALTTRPA